MHFVSSLTWDGFGQYMLICIYWHEMGLVITFWDEFWVHTFMDACSQSKLRYIVFSLARDVFGQQKLKYISSHCWHGRGLIKTIWDTHSVIDEMGWVWSTHIEIHFVFSLAWAGFGLSELSYIFCPRWHGMGLVNARQDIFWVRAGMEGQHMLWYILCPRWHGSVLVNNAAMNFVSTHPILGMT